MRSQKALKNVKVDLIITLLIVFLGFVSRKIFIEYMGADFTGLMLLFVQLIGMINIAELGVGTATASLLYKPLSENNHQAINKILASTVKVYKFISGLVFTVGIVTGIIVYYNVPSVANVEYSQYYWLLYVVNTALSYLFAHYFIILTADQKYHATRIIQGGAKILCISIQLVIIIYYQNFLLYILSDSLFFLLQYIFFKRKVSKEYSFIAIKSSGDISGEFKSVKNKIKKVFFHKLGAVLVFNTDYIIISKFLTLTTVTLYSSYMMVFQALTMFINIFGNSVTASVGNFLVQNDSEERKELWRRVIILFFFLATCITLITTITITDFVRLWIGDGLFLDKITLYLLAFNLFVLISKVALDVIKNASGEFGDVLLPVFEGVINIIVSIILVKKIGLAGVIIGTVVSNIVITCLAKPTYLFKKVTQGTVLELIVSIFQPALLSLFSVIVVMHFSDYWQRTESFYEWLLNAILVSIIIIPIVTIIFSTAKEFRYVIRKVAITLLKR
ncbi:lipopolysaccharide biosynthesis protein [Kluyvera cryocrescens]|uniref:lipopolysaccharide biosynthesis protein n=1 Tax=Kluyvera cryocrescens TaxID=580 RepID=UPI0039F4C760